MEQTMTPKQFNAIAHSPECGRNGDTYAQVYGKPDPQCPRCNAWKKVRAQAERRLFG